MTKKNENTETQTEEKNRLVGHLSYLPHREKGYGSRIGPVFSTSRDDCKSLLVESMTWTSGWRRFRSSLARSVSRPVCARK